MCNLFSDCIAQEHNLKERSRMAKKAAPKSTKKAPKQTKQTKQIEVLLVGTKVKAALRAHNVNVGEGTLDALNGILHWYIQQAACRAQANKRKTVRGHDVALM